MADENAAGTDDFAKVVGARLRAIRRRQRLSLQAVEKESGGKLRAVVVGSYERGDRAASVRRLAELADFYGVPIDALVTDRTSSRSPNSGGKVRLRLAELRAAPEEAALFASFVASIQDKRGDYGAEVLTIRAADLDTAALLYQVPSEKLRQMLVDWDVIDPT